MKSKSNIAAAITIMELLPLTEVNEEVIQDYEKLNDRCDKVITKIKNRKRKKDTKKKTN